MFHLLFFFFFYQPELVSTPNFVVEVTKQPANQALVFDCHFPEDEASFVFNSAEEIACDTASSLL